MAIPIHFALTNARLLRELSCVIFCKSACLMQQKTEKHAKGSGIEGASGCSFLIRHQSLEYAGMQSAVDMLQIKR